MNTEIKLFKRDVTTGSLMAPRSWDSIVIWTKIELKEHIEEEKHYKNIFDGVEADLFIIITLNIDYN